MMKNRRICVIPTPRGVGGMVSFYHRFKKELDRRNIEVTSSLRDKPYDAILVIGGSRYLLELARAHREGVRIIQRLDGMNWIHRRRWAGLKHYIKAEYGNYLLSFIRKRYAHGIIYQSEFARKWWENVYGKANADWKVIYNGVDLQLFSPEGDTFRVEENTIRLMMIEGNLEGGYEHGIQYGLELATKLQKLQERTIELVIVGKVSDEIKRRWTNVSQIPLHFAGILNSEDIPKILRSATLFYASDIHPACPNTVIEAMACGVPAVAFDTGALPEIIANGAGEVVPYGGNAWKMEPPNTDNIVLAADKIIRQLKRYKENARRHCEMVFRIEKMVDDYLEVIFYE